MQKLRDGKSLLFNTICAVVCRARNGGQSQFWQILGTHVTRMHSALMTTGQTSIEMIQSLLIRACYSSERALLISMAIRMALELGLPEAYNNLASQIIFNIEHVDESLECDLHKTRTWLSILVLRLMLGIGTESSPDFNFSGNERRYRALLDKPFSTELDLCLLEQVELNLLRARIYRSLTGRADHDDQALLMAIRDARVDIEVWFKDWTHILNSQSSATWLRVNLEVQRHWTDITTLCWALISKGNSIDILSGASKNILLMAKNALQELFQTIIAQPRLYIQNLRYATDYVWAKLVFCYLLLLDI